VPTAAGIDVGARAPEFELKNQYGARVRPAADWQRGPLVLFFFPDAGASEHAIEARAFGEVMNLFRAEGASLVAVSRDRVVRHAFFAVEHSLTFTLLSDPGGRVAKLYGLDPAPADRGVRLTYVIDHQGIVRYRFASSSHSYQHVSGALEVVRGLVRGRPSSTPG
jgi:peroxiredoxin Q/BCP